MAWWNFIGDALKGGKDVAEVFVENKTQQGQHRHEEEMADIQRDLASLSQFSDEFHARKNRTWWDSFVDGLNRLPRPLLTIAILSFFVLAPLSPTRFLEIAKAYELMPPGYWALLSIIIGFYFGGRMQLKAQDFNIQKNAVHAAKELVQIRKEFRQLDDGLESTESKIFDAVTMTSGSTPKNSVIKQWLESRKNQTNNQE